MPPLRQCHAAFLDALKHPDKRKIGQRTCRMKPAKLPANVTMRTAEPNLFDLTTEIRRAFPKHGFKNLARLIQCQGVIAMKDMIPKPVIVKGMR